MLTSFRHHPSIDPLAQSYRHVLCPIARGCPGSFGYIWVLSCQLLCRRALRLVLCAGCAYSSGSDLTGFVFLFQTDGASAVLLMSEEKALAMGYKPKAYLR